MTLPEGWLANSAPGERNVPPYTGDQTGTWLAGQGGATGIQPGGDNNPAGTAPSVPAMSQLAALASLEGDPRRLAQ